MFLACQGKQPSPSGAVASGTQGAPQQPAQKVPAATCKMGNQVDPKTRAVLEGHALRLVAALRGGALEPLWSDLHPDLRSDAARPKILASLDQVAKAITDVTTSDAEAKVRHVVLLEIAPGVDERLKIECAGVPSLPDDDWTIATRVAGQDMALVTVTVRGAAMDPTLLVRLRKSGDTWHLQGIEQGLATLGGKDARSYAEAARAQAEAGRTVPAYLLYGVAQTLAAPGRGVSTAVSRQIGQALSALDPKAALAEILAPAGLEQARIVGLGLTRSTAGLAPRLRYVTRRSLEDGAALRAEAVGLARALIRAEPALAKHFGTMIFEAYAKPPSDPQQAYDAGRTVVALDDI